MWSAHPSTLITQSGQTFYLEKYSFWLQNEWRSLLPCYLTVYVLSPLWLFATPWTVAHQAPLSMGFCRQEYWSGLPFPSPGDLPNWGIEPTSPDISYVGRQILHHWATTEDCKKIFFNLFSHFQLRTSQSWLCYLVCWVHQRLVMELLQSPCFLLPSWYMLSKNQVPPITPASLLILLLSFIWVGEVSCDASHVLVSSKVAHFKRNGFCQKSKLKLFNKTRSTMVSD